MLSLEQQEAYRQRHANICRGWRPASHVYQDLVAARLSPTARVLDLGCGRGGVMERLHAQAGFASGLDPDLASLGGHRAHALALACGIAEALPYADGSFDLVCCSWVLEHLPDPARTFGEIVRVLRRPKRCGEPVACPEPRRREPPPEGTPGTRFVFLTPNARHPLLVLNHALRRTQGRLVGRFYDRAEADTFPAFYRANTPSRIEHLAQAAGLKRVSLHLIGDPTYLAFGEPLFRLSCLLERIMPAALRVHLVGEYAIINSDQ